MDEIIHQRATFVRSNGIPKGTLLRGAFLYTSLVEGSLSASLVEGSLSASRVEGSLFASLVEGSLSASRVKIGLYLPHW